MPKEVEVRIRNNQNGPSTTINVFEMAATAPGQSANERAESSVAWERDSKTREISGKCCRMTA